MTALTKVKLSGSTNGRGIKVVATATAGTTIHTTGTSATVIDEVWLYAYNSDTVPVVLTVEWGGATAPDDNIKLSIPAQSGAVLVVPGLILTGTGGAGLVVAAFASSANKVVITGYVNRLG